LSVHAAQLSLGVPGDPQLQAQSDGSLAGDVLSVAADLVGSTYQLGTIPSPFEPTGNLEVYEALTCILPTLSEQSAFFWERAARPLASQLATARYPIRAQASHLIFWWARLGGLMGPTTRRGGGQELSLTSDASNVEFSWAIPPTSNRKEESNPRVRFSIDPFHPERGHRMAGGAFINYLCSAEGGMGLVKSEPGCTLWKEIIEKWLFPDIKSTEEFVEGSAYGVAFDLEPSGAINLKGYYVPPLPPSAGPNPQTRVTSYRGRPISPELMLRLTKDLHPSLEAPMNALFDFLYSLDLDVRKGMVLHMISYDLTRPEKNRLKMPECEIYHKKLQDSVVPGFAARATLQISIRFFVGRPYIPTFLVVSARTALAHEMTRTVTYREPAPREWPMPTRRRVLKSTSTPVPKFVKKEYIARAYSSHPTKLLIRMMNRLDSGWIGPWLDSGEKVSKPTLEPDPHGDTYPSPLILLRRRPQALTATKTNPRSRRNTRADLGARHQAVM
ncbi:hypothetical protein H0H93_002458, partial [Arthromyces matolae]